MEPRTAGPAGDDDAEPDTPSWDAPNEDEIASAGRKAGLQIGDDDEEEEEETEEEEKPARKPADERKPADSKETETPETPSYLEVSGRRWTADEIKSLNEREQQLSDALRATRGENKELQNTTNNLRNDYQALQKALMQKAGILQSEGAEGDGEVDSPAAQKAIQAVNDRIQKLQEKIDSGEQSRAEEQEHQTIRNVFDNEFKRLCGETERTTGKKLEENMVSVLEDLVRNRLIREDPDLTDPLTGLTTDRMIREAVGKMFREQADRLFKNTRATQADVVANLRQGTARTAPQPKPSPKAPPKNAHKSPFLRNKERDSHRSGWNSDKAIGEVLGGVADIGNE